jgi:hypothetical protein
MSANEDPKDKPSEEQGHSYSPRPTKFTFEDVQQFGDFFKKLLDDSHIRKWIILAGIGGALEAAHIIWLAAWWIILHFKQ